LLIELDWEWRHFSEEQMVAVLVADGQEHIGGRRRKDRGSRADDWAAIGKAGNTAGIAVCTAPGLG
jgi:hypothetical protein